MRTPTLCLACFPLFAFGVPMASTAEIADTADTSADSPTLAYIESVRSDNVRHSGRTAVVEFEDGERVPVTKYNGPASYEVIGPLAMEHDALAHAASDRGDVADALSRALRRCQVAPTSLEDATAQVARVRAGDQFLLPRFGSPEMNLGSPEEREERYRNHMMRELTFCDGVTAKQKSQADYWLAKAAGMGDPIAALNYAEQLGNRPEAFAFWVMAWQAGYADALQSLARLYREGRSDVPIRSPDRVRAHTHQYLYVRLMESLGPTDRPMGRIRARLLAEAQNELQSLERELKIGEREESISQAKAMLKANTNCCQPL